MQRVRQKNTSAESALRRELHARGLRYRIHVPVLTKPRRVADVAFSGLRVAVFVDGCFWHGCPEHATWPKQNADFWRAKIEANHAARCDTDAAAARRGLEGRARLGARSRRERAAARDRRASSSSATGEGPSMTTPARRSRPVALFDRPEPGQLVEVRRRQWIVSDVDASAVAPELPKRNLVKLASIDEDALGEEIEVLWELEPGAHVIERAGLPTLSALDDPSTLEAFLDAVRWGAATNADRGYLQAPFRSGVSIEDYQLDPLVRAIDMPRVNLLIADDVGLGKTIEAGLVAQEMLLRHRARTVLVVCPSSLQVKWRNEMAEKFGLEFRIVDTEYVKRSAPRARHPRQPVDVISRGSSPRSTG